MFHEFFYQIKDKINLIFKTWDDLNFYEIGPRPLKRGTSWTLGHICPAWRGLSGFQFKRMHAIPVGGDTLHV